MDRPTAATRATRARPRERGVPLLVAALAVGCLSACGGGRPRDVRAEASTNGSEAPLCPTLPEAESADLQQLAEDLAARLLCERMEGQFLAIGGDADRPSNGRLWVRECDTEVRDRTLHASLDTTVWQWIDRESSAVGATFEVSQYVVLEADLTIRGDVRVAYERPSRIVSAFLVPRAPPSASVRVIGPVEAEAQGLWGEIVGGIADAFSESPSERARHRVREEGAAQIESELASGMTVTVDLCTGQLRSTLDRLEVGELPEPAVEPEAARWLDTARVRLHPQGLDAAGPFRASARVAAEVRSVEGGTIRVQLVCEDEAERVVRAWIESDRNALPARIDAVAEVAVAPNDSATIRAPEGTQCAIVVLTTPVAPQTSTVELVVHGVHLEARPLVDGCEAR